MSRRVGRGQHLCLWLSPPLGSEHIPLTQALRIQLLSLCQLLDVAFCHVHNVWFRVLFVLANDFLNDCRVSRIDRGFDAFVRHVDLVLLLCFGAAAGRCTLLLHMAVARGALMKLLDECGVNLLRVGLSARKERENDICNLSVHGVCRP